VLLFAIISIALALVLYSVGVWSEKIQKTLLKWHIIILWFSFLFNSVGTTLMRKFAESTFANANRFNANGITDITGIIAVLLLLFHAIWATVVLTCKDEAMIKPFHKYSVLVWAIWLIPFSLA
jgi:uncharacterized repeat protein (TIGR03987 family)